MRTSKRAVEPSRFIMGRSGQRLRIGTVAAGIVLALCTLSSAPVARASVGHVLLLSGGGKHGDQQKQVDQLEKQWRMALLAGDNATLATLLADSYVGIGPDGTIMSKSEELQARASGQEHLERLDVDDRKVRIYGTTAVVTSKARVQGVYFGQPLLGEYRYTRVWSLTRGQWHIVSFESNRVHDADERSR